MPTKTSGHHCGELDRSLSGREDRLEIPVAHGEDRRGDRDQPSSGSKQVTLAEDQAVDDHAKTGRSRPDEGPGIRPARPMARRLLIQQDDSDHRDDAAGDREPHAARRGRDQRREEQDDPRDDHEIRPAGVGDRLEWVDLELAQHEQAGADDDEDDPENGKASPSAQSRSSIA